MKFTTQAIHVGNEPEFKTSGDVVVPIHLATTFARQKVSQPTGGYEYSRSGNPTRLAVEKSLAALESGQFAFAYASGLAAETNLLFLLKAGDHIIVSDDVYGGTKRLFDQVFKPFDLAFSYVDLSGNQGYSHMEEAINKNTRLIWIESPTNPLLKTIDIASVAKLTKSKKILTVVDNTFASPYFQQPLKLGADLVLHSTTKYLSGHSDTLGGAIVTNSRVLAQKLKFLQNAVGAILSPFDSWLLLRGIKTLSLRMPKHQENAMAVVKFLQNHQLVKKVYYPGFSGVLSFELNASLKKAIKFMESLKLIHIAESLGAVESLIEHPASMTHASIPAVERKKIGLADGLIRLSVGLEDSDDIINDLKQALNLLK